MFKQLRNNLLAPARRLLPGRLAHRFARAEDAAAAVEFALVAAPFLALLFAILETALVFFAGQSLEAAATDAGRLIMTGQAQNGAFSQNDFKTSVCNTLAGGLFDCVNGVTVDVQSYASFQDVGTAVATTPIKNGQLDTTNMGYTPGGPSSIVVVRLYYQWPIYLSLLNNNLANLSNGDRLLVATSVFRNEPF